MLNHVSLFSGYGGLDLGLKMAIPDLRTVLYCEYDRYAQGVLISRMRDGGLDPAPIWTDVRTLDGRPWRGCVDIISGGFPCQDVSVIGKRIGIEGERSGLWKDFARVIEQSRPAVVFIENTSGLQARGLNTVLQDLAAMRYDATWEHFAASDIGAPHERFRLFVLAYSNEEYGKRWPESYGPYGFEREAWNQYKGCCNQSGYEMDSQWYFEPLVDRVVNGSEFGVDRLGLLGNGVVPEQAALAFQILSERINK